MLAIARLITITFTTVVGLWLALETITGFNPYRNMLTLLGTIGCFGLLFMIIYWEEIAREENW